MLSKKGRHYEKKFKEPTSNCRESADLELSWIGRPRAAGEIRKCFFRPTAAGQGLIG